MKRFQGAFYSSSSSTVGYLICTVIYSFVCFDTFQYSCTSPSYSSIRSLKPCYSVTGFASCHCRLILTNGKPDDNGFGDYIHVLCVIHLWQSGSGLPSCQQQEKQDEQEKGTRTSKFADKQKWLSQLLI